MQSTDVQRITTETANTWLTKAETALIVDRPSFQDAAGNLDIIIAFRKQAEDHHRPIIKAAHEAHKQAVAALQRVDDSFKQAELKYRTKMASFLAEEKRRADEERLRLEAEERKRHEEEQEKAIEQAEAAGATPAEVQAIIQQAEATPAVQVFVPEPEKPRGYAMPETWSAEVIDIKVLCRAIADGQASANLITPNLTALNQMARAMKGTFNVPGCKAVRSYGIRRTGR